MSDVIERIQRVIGTDEPPCAVAACPWQAQRNLWAARQGDPSLMRPHYEEPVEKLDAVRLRIVRRQPRTDSHRIGRPKEKLALLTDPWVVFTNTCAM